MDRRTILQSALSCLGLPFVGGKKRERQPSTYVTIKLIAYNCGQVITHPISLNPRKSKIVYPFWVWTYCFMDYKTFEVRQILGVKQIAGAWFFLLGHETWEFEENAAEVSRGMELFMRERMPAIRKKLLGPCLQRSDEAMLNEMISSMK